ncbi:MAG: class II glutamine amidotransferase [Myxococcota bacterium]
MCRLFGFRSVIPSQVHRSLVAADNALGVQSDQHPDGWGVAYYVDGSPHLTRSPSTALGDHLFQRVSGVVSSETVLAHVRKATVGELSVLNCHPFQYGRWTFAHNGEVKEFDRHRERVLNEVAPRLRRFILGETDSEALFYLFLTNLARHGPLGGRIGLEEVVESLRRTVEQARALCDGPGEEGRALLTFIVTDGQVMAAVRSGKELFFSTYKTRCADREACPSLSPECEAPSRSGFVNHLLISSEPLLGENVWVEMRDDEVVGVDARMRLMRSADAKRRLAVAAAE